MADLKNSLQSDVSADQIEIDRLIAVRDRQIADIASGFQVQIDKLQKQLDQKSGFIQAATDAGIDLAKVAVADAVVDQQIVP